MLVTREQLDQLEQDLRPLIAKFLEEPELDTAVTITCAPVMDDPDGAALMRFEVKVRGKNIDPEQEEKVSKLLLNSGVGQIVKAKT
jgi:hypothetical protein